MTPTTIDDFGLDAELEQAMRTQAEKHAADFAAFAQIIADKRNEAVTGRRSAGIDEIWRAAEEAYIGIDDVNRHEYGGGWTKGSTPTAPIQRNTGGKPDGTQATGFVRLTARYVDAGSAKVAEICIPVDGKAFSLKATPIPDAVEMTEDTSQYVHGGQPMFRPPKAGEQLQPGPDGQPPTQVPLTVKDLAEHVVEQAEKSAKKAATRIHDWHIECGRRSQLRRVIFDGARLGVGIMKGPVPESRLSKAILRMQDGIALKLVSKTVPTSKRVDPWKFYPDPACGENIHDGDYVLEEDSITLGKLEALKRTGRYINSAIDKVLEEGPAFAFATGGRPDTLRALSKSVFTIWHFYGRITREQLELCNPKAAESVPKGADSVFAIVTLINDTPIRVVLNPLDSGAFPYHTFSWRPRSGSWAGIGVAEQIRFPQRLLNSAVRAGMNNAAKSAGGILAFDDLMLESAKGDGTTIVPDMVFRRASESTLDDVRKAIAVFQIPNVTPQILQWVELAFKMAEESTNIPLVTQGQSGDTTPDTFGGQQLQDSNATQLLRDVGYAVAEGITNPETEQYYEWLLLDPDVPDDEKGDHQVDANGAVALIEKALQDRALMMIAPMAADPGYGFDKHKLGKAIVRMNRLSPDDLMLSDEEVEQAKQQPPMPPPAVAAAQIRAQSAEKIASERNQVEAHRIDTELDRDVAFEQALDSRERTNAEYRDRELHMRWQLALLEYAKAQRINLEDAKSQLAQTVMKLRVQERLAGIDGKGPQVATPPDEPPGRAPNGTAFQR